MVLRHTLLTTFLITLVPGLGYAQQLPELPPPRPVNPAPAPVRPVRLPPMAKQAAESNLWKPVCDPPGPTPGLWGDCPPCAHCYSWQERSMQCRDFLEWCCTRPTCAHGMRPPPSASLFDWMTQWWPASSRQ
jgi:hypothetical protein